MIGKINKYIERGRFLKIDNEVFLYGNAKIPVFRWEFSKLSEKIRKGVYVMRNEIETKCNENILDVETLFEAIYEAMNTSREVEQSENAA